MAKKLDMTQKVKELMDKKEQIRNIGIIAHIDHGKTTFSDNLLAGSGMISGEHAGKQLFMDTEAQEQERGITIYSANVSMIHKKNDNFYLINMIDTPGHVDFGGDVTRAMRAVDGAICLIDAVEGVMPQTETVLRQALKERVRPILFINKVDRMIKELQLTPEAMQQRFVKMIADFNGLIKKYAEEDFKKWTVKVEDGSVAFGSAYKNWALSAPYMQASGVTFKDVIDMTNKGDEGERELAEKAPLHEVVFDMVVKHLPNPKQAQPYRIPKIWAGDEESDIGQSMRLVDSSGKLACIVTKLYPDPHAGMVGTARIFSGSIKSGQEVYLINQHKPQRAQQVCIYKGSQKIPMQEITAGNIIGLIGMPDLSSGETVCDPKEIIKPFEAISHIFEPVVTKAIEARKTADLPKMIEFLRRLGKEDSTLRIEINQETGECLVSGLGELHIEAKVERGLKDLDLDVQISPPIVVYRETVSAKSSPYEGKSPNKHNRFYIEVEPIPEAFVKLIENGEIEEGDIKGKVDNEIVAKLREIGISDQDSKGIITIKNKSIFTDATKGVQYLNEINELMKESFNEVIAEGPLSREPTSNVMVRLVDATLHEDSIHRGPAQVIPAVRAAIKNAMLEAKATLLEPKQILRVDSPEEYMGAAMREVQNRRGEVLDVQNEEGVAILQAKVPVSEMFGFEGQLKSATGGKGFFFLTDIVFENIPRDLLDKTVLQIRSRKGLSGEIPKVGEVN